MWEGIKDIFNSWAGWVFAFPLKLVQAGANIVGSIWQGMKNKWHEFIAWWAEKIQAIRNFLPFSPAKVGPLRDIHRIKLFETIAMAVKPQPLLNAMDNSLNAVAGYGGNRYGGGGSSSSHNHYSFTVNLTGGATQKDADMMTSAFKQNVLRVITENENRKQRVGY